LAQDDEGFEIADFGEEGDDSGDEEDGRGNEGARYDAPSKSVSKQAPHQTSSEPEAQASTTPKTIPRESLDGETIFAVGDEDGDKWSDDDDDDNEGRKLVGKNH
jgi:hypothetical protein